MTDVTSYEIERKYLVKCIPNNIESYPHHELEQGYLSSSPVVRVRKTDNDYTLTYKSAGLMKRREVELPLDKESYEHLLAKSDGTIISKTRYIIPDGNHNIELDIFHNSLDGFIMAEVEFTSVSDSNTYLCPDWFSKEVTANPVFQNNNISRMSDDECALFLQMVKNDSM